MRIVILTVGSLGDVEPFVALGAGLRRAGHDVRIATHLAFEATVRGAGLEFALLPGDPRAMRAEVEGELAVAGARQFRVIGRIRRAVAPLVGEGLRAAEAACRDAEVILYRDVLAFVGYALAEAGGARPVGASLVPRTPTRAFAFPRPLPFGATANLLSGHLTHAVYWQLLRGAINHWRTKELGLSRVPVFRPYADARRRRVPILYGFSEALLPHPPDWPPWHHVTGHWFLETPADWAPPDDLAEFLAAGPPPVYVGFGSSVARDAAAVTEQVVAALELTGQRGILATGWGGLALPRRVDPARVYALESAPHDWLFPRVAAIVHHGGIGTTAAGLRAGLPTIVVSAFGDQFFWAERVAALGAGPRPIPRRRLTAQRLADAIRVATTDERIWERAGTLGERLRAEDGVANAVAVLSRLLESEPWRWDR